MCRCGNAIKAEHLLAQKEFSKILFTDKEGKEYLFKPT